MLIGEHSIQCEVLCFKWSRWHFAVVNGSPYNGLWYGADYIVDSYARSLEVLLATVTCLISITILPW